MSLNGNPSVVFAEVIHFSNRRSGNVSFRPNFYGYEIVSNAKSSLDYSLQIPLNDILISIRNQRVVLRSKKLSKEIIPRLSNAHNFVIPSQPVYRFLGELQSNGFIPGLSFDWGPLKREFVFLPRLVFKNVVLSPARWNLKANDYKVLIECEGDKLEGVVSRWMETFRIPQKFLLVDGDNELLIELRHPLILNMFIRIISKRESITLSEFLYDPERSVVSGTNGSFCNQFVIPLWHNCTDRESIKGIQLGGPHERHPALTEDRFFIPGSNWIYYKLYCGKRTADYVLTEIIKPIVESLYAEKKIDLWFFIRYSDPDQHLRVRFHATERLNFGYIIQKVFEWITPFVPSVVANVLLGTYDREIERYGAETIRHAELLFCYDSACVIGFLSIPGAQKSDEFRWIFGISAVHALISDCILNLEEKLAFIEGHLSLLKPEFNQSKLGLHLDRFFRENRHKIFKILDYPNDFLSEYYVMCGIIQRRSNNNRSIFQDVTDISGPHVSMQLLSSYIHMSVNRIFISDQKLLEVSILELISKYYVYKLRTATKVDNVRF